MGRRVWIDGDSVAREARRLVERHANPRGYEAVIVADRPLRPSSEEQVETVILEPSEEAVDRYLLDHVSPEELVITRDIPLAESLLQRGALVLNDRGEEFTEENIGKRRSERDMMLLLRESGMVSSGGARYGKKELKRFADAFDRFVAKRLQ
ncbi:MAG: DUF188 domain-containing protein [Spirochaetaceae bacterium]